MDFNLTCLIQFILWSFLGTISGTIGLGLSCTGRNMKLSLVFGHPVSFVVIVKTYLFAHRHCQN